MAKVILNPMIKEIRGKMGDIVYRVGPHGQQTIMKRPDMSNVKWSKAQKEHRKRFKKAIAYAHAAMADPQVSKIYEKRAAKENRKPFRVAVSDYLQGNDLFSKK